MIDYLKVRWGCNSAPEYLILLLGFGLADAHILAGLQRGYVLSRIHNDSTYMDRAVRGLMLLLETSEPSVTTYRVKLSKNKKRKRTKMRVASGIHHFDTGPFKWYVIEESSRLTLVDAGFPGLYSTFVKGIESIGRSLKDLEAIVLTHAHADHIGFAERVRKETGFPFMSIGTTS